MRRDFEPFNDRGQIRRGVLEKLARAAGQASGGPIASAFSYGISGEFGQVNTPALPAFLSAAITGPQKADFSYPYQQVIEDGQHFNQWDVPGGALTDANVPLYEVNNFAGVGLNSEIRGWLADSGDHYLFEASASASGGSSGAHGSLVIEDCNFTGAFDFVTTLGTFTKQYQVAGLTSAWGRSASSLIGPQGGSGPLVTAIPIVSLRGLTIDAVAVYALGSNPALATNGQIGLYQAVNSIGLPYPGKLIQNFGTIASGPLFSQNKLCELFGVSAQLTPNTLYFLAWAQSNGAIAGISENLGTGVQPFAPLGGMLFDANGNPFLGSLSTVVGYTLAAGALPAVFPTMSSPSNAQVPGNVLPLVVSGNGVPLIFYHCSA